MFKNNISPLRRKGFKARLLRIKAKTMYGLDYIGGITTSGAVFGKSLYQLSNTYTGYCLRVQRQSDNATLDIGFINGYVNRSDIEAFCTGTNGRVTIWYDQCGGNNATQTSFANMPIICNSGVFSANGIQFIKASQLYLKITNYAALNLVTPVIGIYCNANYVATVTGFLICKNTNGTLETQYALVNVNPNMNLYLEGGSRVSISNPVSKNNILGCWCGLNANETKIYKNSETTQTSTYGASPLTARSYVYIGCRSNSADGLTITSEYEGYMETVIIFNSNVGSYFDILKTKC